MWSRWAFGQRAALGADCCDLVSGAAGGRGRRFAGVPVTTSFRASFGVALGLV